MPPLLFVGAVAFAAAGLSFFSGFGLGTVLLPVFALFFPAEVAVAATAVVHAVNGFLKVLMVGSHAAPSVVLRFGLPSVLAAFVGASALDYVSHFGVLATYSLGSRTAVITPLKVFLSGAMFVFALFELLPRLRELRFDRKHLVLGGVLSGLFGGFSGHQGALRSAFLTKVEGSTEAFVGTTAVISLMVDVTRIATYTAAFLPSDGVGPIHADGWNLVLAAVVGSSCGILLARHFLAAITMQTVRALTGFLLLGIAAALGTGVI
ncbi:MAG: hypothetical protein GHCLOJNM_01527 [bacterium]|nr:hypothetical protein [bacterium]